MSISNSRYQAAQRRQEDEADVKHIMSGFVNEGVSEERLQTIMQKGKEYEATHGSRGNRNMIKACELLLHGVATS